jgi:hypothetical protein
LAAVSPHRASVTEQVPGVHVIEIALAVAVPVQLWGPLRVTLPSLVKVPVKPLNGAANESEQSFCVTTTLCPMSEESQCAVIFHVPAMLGQVALPSPPLAEDELELHAGSNGSAARRRMRSTVTWYARGPRANKGSQAGPPA